MLHLTRIHKPLRMSQAMAAGITDRLWSLDDMIPKIYKLLPDPKARGSYKKSGDANSNGDNPEERPHLNYAFAPMPGSYCQLSRKFVTGRYR